MPASSPLRYPGAKKKVLTKLRPFLAVQHSEYREAFVGGGSIFFGKPLAPMNWLNDLDEEVHAFFLAIQQEPHMMCELVRATKPSLSVWDEIKNSRPEGVVERGFRTLFLNRTNYSGILGANPIGGRGQNPKYPIDCRWNPEMLCAQILACSHMLDGVTITSTDFEPVITAPSQGRSVLLMLDPPYYHKGNSLYQVTMSSDDHRRLAALLRHLDPNSHKFVLTYDDCQEVRKLYEGWAFLHTETWFYSAVKTTVHERRLGRELFITNFAPGAPTGRLME